MFKRVDIDEDSLRGFSFISQSLEETTVDMEYGPLAVRICDPDGGMTIYLADIPKLIKALQAAFDHKKGKA